MPANHVYVWTIAAATTAAVLVRPFKLPEAVWAATGGALVVLLGMLTPGEALAAAAKGGDVYLFLAGMMLLSETARREGLFDWVAGHAVNLAGGSRRRLFLLIYAVGCVTTTFLSNDATAVVLTPAVFAAARQAKTSALPYLFVCALIANAASFVLPISNPANLVLYGDHVPPLLHWLRSFGFPSVFAIVATYVMLRLTQRRALEGHCEQQVDVRPLSHGGWAALASLVVTAVVLMGTSALDRQLGLPTFAMGALTAAVVLLRARAAPWPLLRGISWSVLPLVAGLFVLVEALGRTGVVSVLAQWLIEAAHTSAPGTGAVAGGLLAIGSNVINNLPAGLIASTTVLQAKPPQTVVDALLIGVDLGPNLSITGSLATILWLAAIRREGEDVTFVQFLKVGLVVMPLALVPAIGARLLIG